MNALYLLKLATEVFPISSTERLPGATGAPRHGLTITDDSRLCLNVFRRGAFWPVLLDAVDLERAASDIINDAKEAFALADRNQPTPKSRTAAARSRRPDPVIPNPHGGDLPDRNDRILTLVRELGFDNFVCGLHGNIEKVFFLGPQMLDGREEGAHATEEAVRNFIDYYENQIAVARDYLANGRNNKTHEWTVTAAGNVEAERNEARREAALAAWTPIMLALQRWAEAPLVAGDTRAVQEEFRVQMAALWDDVPAEHRPLPLGGKT